MSSTSCKLWLCYLLLLWIGKQFKFSASLSLSFLHPHRVVKDKVRQCRFISSGDFSWKKRKKALSPLAKMINLYCHNKKSRGRVFPEVVNLAAYDIISDTECFQHFTSFSVWEFETWCSSLGGLKMAENSENQILNWLCPKVKREKDSLPRVFKDQQWLYQESVPSKFVFMCHWSKLFKMPINKFYPRKVNRITLKHDLSLRVG